MTGPGYYRPGEVPPAPVPHVRPLVRPVGATRSPDGLALVASFGAPGPSSSWQVRRITVTGPAGSHALVYVGNPADAGAFVDGTNTGALDVAEYVVPLYVPEGAPLTVRWVLPAGGPITGQAVARVEYDETSTR